jgi:epoxide hydrolase-like predicted phosphatase
MQKGGKGFTLIARDLSEILWRSPDWRQAEVGQISEEEYWRRIAPRLGLLAPDAIQALQQELFRDVRADPRMVELVRRLPGRYRTGLLSNTSINNRRRLVEQYRLNGLFDAIVLSAAVGVAKPDPTIYRLILERLGTAPEATVFVDDYRPNVAAAAGMGMQGIHFLGHEALVSALRELGVEGLAGGAL